MLIEKSRIKVICLNEKKDFPFAPLEAMGPNISGWGVVETTLLLPESVCLMVGPLACLRHSAFMAHARDFFNRFYMLPIDELDIVMARHLRIIKNAIKEIILETSPKIFILSSTCCDHILGTDYKRIIQEIEEEFDIKLIYTVMAPLTIGQKPSPFEMAYSALYEYLKKIIGKKVPSRLNILGNFLPITNTSELYNLCNNLGLTIYQIPRINTAEELSLMTTAELNIVIHPLGEILAKKMKKGLGIPFLFVPVSYGLLEIEQNYKKLSEKLGKYIDYTPYKKEAHNYIAKRLNLLRDKKVAVGCSIYGNPFELADALLEYGCDVKAIFCRNAPKLFELQYIKRLKEKSPETFIYNISHPYLMEKLDVFDDIDISFGVDAGICCRNSVNVPLSRYKLQTYGFENAILLFKEIEKYVSTPIKNYDWIYKHNLLI